MKELLMQEPYKSFFKRIEDDGHKIILITLGGSHAYGTNVEGSDIDIRGIYLNSVDELLGIKPDKEQYVSQEADICMYSLKKAAWLIKACNPAMLEILGCRDEDYLYLTKEGQCLRNNLSLFLSKRVRETFGGYAKSQLNKLINRSGRAKDEILNNEERSFEKSFMTLRNRYTSYIDKSAEVKQEDGTIKLSFSVKDAPVSQVAAILEEFNSIDRAYRKSTRNEKATTHGKLSKLMMHLIRLYCMGTEVLTSGKVNTYRAEEHDLLMSIRNGEYLEDDGLTPTSAFQELLDTYQHKFEAACNESILPEEADEDKVNKIVIDINRYNLQ